MDDVVAGVRSPFELDVRPIARFLNAELRDHPVYDGLELQWFDDAWHGTGMLAFLSRRADRRVDYYADPTLSLDRSTYQIGGGTGAWSTTEFEADRLDVDAGGVVADVRFTDIDGRRIEVNVDDRGRRPRRSSDLLAPVGGGIDEPASLLLVYLHGFDLVRRSRRPPRILVDGMSADTGVLPGGFLHRRHLIKAAAPLTVVTLCPTRHDEPLPPVSDPDHRTMSDDGAAIAGVAAARGDLSARLVLDPPLPDLVTLPDGVPLRGAWRLDVDGAAVTGGAWRAQRRGARVELGLDVTQPWEPPAGRPLLMRIVTRVVPLFRTWPTTYRWSAQVELAVSGGRITSSWQRTTTDRGESYRRATGGRGPRSAS
ncbi:MAG TPA: hypothetical protein VK906_09145 [Egicoccus sp.]|nr:hypothetical protein [Egicoccus sp.]HSK23328.1 hypothetical protein [Egicoccus sp.]